MELKKLAAINHLTLEEVEKLHEIFNSFDKDCSGYIDSNELRILLNSQEMNPSEEEIFQMIEMVDDKNTGNIHFSQFLKVIAQ